MGRGIQRSHFSVGHRRQNDTTNTVVPNGSILSGWGVFSVGAAANKSETVTFAQPFLEAPIVIITYGGDDSLGGTTLGSGGNSDKGPVCAKAHTVTATNFVAHVHTPDGTSWAAGSTVFYHWIAIGRLA